MYGVENHRRDLVQEVHPVRAEFTHRSWHLVVSVECIGPDIRQGG